MATVFIQDLLSCRQARKVIPFHIPFGNRAGKNCILEVVKTVDPHITRIQLLQVGESFSSHADAKEASQSELSLHRRIHCKHCMTRTLNPSSGDSCQTQRKAGTSAATQHSCFHYRGQALLRRFPNHYVPFSYLGKSLVMPQD